MPTAIVGAIFPALAGALGITGGFVVANVVAFVVVPAALGLGAAALASSLATTTSPTAGNQTATPKPEDGKYNLKQSVPPLTYILGRVKKGGDYVFLEERGGIAYHVTVHAAHSILAYALHYLHDEAVELDVNDFVETPAHFGVGNVMIKERLGADAETAFAEIVSAFPEIWTTAHRGDGLSSVLLLVNTVPGDVFQATYPQGMPQHTAIIQGHDRLYDPLTETYGYSENLALFRLWHLTHAVGGKLSLDDLYMADWITAAGVCDEIVIDREEAEQRRYHGGFWFRSNNDPVEVGRIIDQAADMVIYERADGTVGVHPGRFVEPDVRLTADDIVSCRYDANRRAATSVAAVRGRWTNPGAGYSTVDAAIYGDPYADDGERTRTVDNQAVQRHNHIARLQKLAFIRARAPRVQIVAHFEPARQVPYRRFIRVHLPPKLDEAVIEIVGRPTLSLVNLTYEFEGIVVPADLYDFNAATEEGAPGIVIDVIDREDVPEPDVDDVTIETETVAEGTAAFILWAFTLQNAAFQYEIEWEPTAGGPSQSFTGAGGALTVRSGYLADATEYRTRARTWSGGTASAWSDYEILTAP